MLVNRSPTPPSGEPDAGRGRECTSGERAPLEERFDIRTGGSLPGSAPSGEAHRADFRRPTESRESTRAFAPFSSAWPRFFGSEFGFRLFSSSSDARPSKIINKCLDLAKFYKKK